MPEVEDTEKLKTFIKLVTGLSYHTLEDFNNFLVTEKIYEKLPADMDVKAFVFQFMVRCSDLFLSCQFKSEEYDCCDGFFPAFTENGFCYSFNGRHFEEKPPWEEYELPPFELKFIKETDLKWSLKFKIMVQDEQDKLPIYIHNSDEMVAKSLKPQLTWDYKVDRISFSVKQTYTTEDARQLTIKQRHCIFKNEKKLDNDYMYTYSACTEQCRLKKIVQYCNCIPFFYANVYDKKQCSFLDYKCIYDNLAKIEDEKKCECELGCLNTVYEVGKLNENTEGDEFEKELETEFVSWPMVRYKREVLFGWVDLLVSFGGIAGLFLGFSLLSGVEIIYYFTVRACCMVYQEKEELEKFEYMVKIKPKPDYDLSLKPYFISKPLPGYGMDEVIKHYRKGNQRNNKIEPVHSKQKRGSAIYPPFGIEFVN